MECPLTEVPVYSFDRALLLATFGELWEHSVFTAAHNCTVCIHMQGSYTHTHLYVPYIYVHVKL